MYWIVVRNTWNSSIDPVKLSQSNTFSRSLDTPPTLAYTSNDDFTATTSRTEGFDCL